MATVTNQTQFRSALSARESEIILANNITLTTYSTISYEVTIKGATAGISLFWGSPSVNYPNMLVISATGILTLESITLDAQNRDGTLVQINGGTLIVNDETTLQNINTTTAKNTVSIASNSSTVGGTFIMNGGKITGVRGETAVFCAGGSVVMNNNAEISGNFSTGVSVTQPRGGARGSLTMTGNSRIYGNRPVLQGAGGVVIYIADMYMGVNEGDAPQIYDNRPPAGNMAGGILLSDGSTLTMRYDSKIWGNYTDYVGGGILAQDTVITMHDNASIIDNICEGSYGGGGVRLLRSTQLILEDKAHISNNTSTSYGGGVYMQAGAYLEMKGDSYIFDNEAEYGGGIFAAASTDTLKSSLLIGSDNSFPQIYENTANEDGGGICIRSQSVLNLTGCSCIHDNNAIKGKGIYKAGILNVSQSSQVLDGLFFDDISDNAITAYRGASLDDIRILVTVPEEGSHIELKTIKQDESEENAAVTLETLALQEPRYTDNVPVIIGQLTETAEIHLEASEYVVAPNVPLVIADKGMDYPQLGETDRAAWHIPADFGQEYEVILNEEQNQVLIVHEIYDIDYCHLYGTAHSNPESYSKDSEFPIVLLAPEEREGYLFAGWHNCEGELVSEIPQDTTGDILLIALWKANPIYSIKYCHLYGADNPNPDSYSEESEFPIVLQKLEEQNGYEFAGWYDCAGGYITEIKKGTQGDLILIALWKEKLKEKLYLNFEGNAPCVSDVPELISVSSGSIVTIPADKPKRQYYCFESWNTCPRGTGKNYAPKDKIIIADTSITLYSLWTLDCNNECNDSSDSTQVKHFSFRKKR